MEFNRRGPHSLGKSVEWKRSRYREGCGRYSVPTRWGNKLNGN